MLMLELSIDRNIVVFNHQALKLYPSRSWGNWPWGNQLEGSVGHEFPSEKDRYIFSFLQGIKLKMNSATVWPMLATLSQLLNMSHVLPSVWHPRALLNTGKARGRNFGEEMPFHKAWTWKVYASVCRIWAVVQPLDQLWAFPLQSTSSTWHSGDSGALLKLHKFHPLWVYKKCLLLKNYIRTLNSSIISVEKMNLACLVQFRAQCRSTQDGWRSNFGSLSWIHRKADAETMNTAARGKDSLNVSVSIHKSWGSSPGLVPGFSSGTGIRNICSHKQKLLQSSRLLFISFGISLSFLNSYIFSTFSPLRVLFCKIFGETT